MTTMRRSSSDSLLAEELRSVVRGRVRFDTSSRAMWSADASNYRQVPIGVVQPVDLDDVEATRRRRAAQHDVPVLPRGASTSIAGQAVNEAVVARLLAATSTAVLEIDPEARTARVQPGVVLDDLRDAAPPARPDLRPRSRPRTAAARSAG